MSYKVLVRHSQWRTFIPIHNTTTNPNSNPRSMVVANSASYPPLDGKWVVAYGLRGERLVWLIEAVVCLLSANRWSSCSFTRAFDGCKCAAVSLAHANHLYFRNCKALLATSPSHVRSAIASAGLCLYSYQWLWRADPSSYEWRFAVGFTFVCRSSVRDCQVGICWVHAPSSWLRSSLNASVSHPRHGPLTLDYSNARSVRNATDVTRLT